MAFQMTDIIPALPEIFLAGLALVLVLVAAFGGEGAGNARRVTRLSLVGIAMHCSCWCRAMRCHHWPLVACLLLTPSRST
jgi:hypothetical protein